MNLMNFLAVYEDYKNPIYDDGSIGFGKAVLIALIAILIVFVVLVIIIGSIKILQLCVNKFSKEKAIETPQEEVSAPVEDKTPSTEIEDDDMMVAVLVATIDYANETKKDVKLKSVKRIG